MTNDPTASILRCRINAAEQGVGRNLSCALRRRACSFIIGHWSLVIGHWSFFRHYGLGIRHSPTRHILASLCMLLALISAVSAAQQNILLIIADDYGVDSNSLYNSSPSASLPPTPTIASLAQGGVLFRNAYANP